MPAGGGLGIDIDQRDAVNEEKDVGQATLDTLNPNLIGCQVIVVARFVVVDQLYIAARLDLGELVSFLSSQPLNPFLVILQCPEFLNDNVCALVVVMTPD